MSLQVYKFDPTMHSNIYVPFKDNNVINSLLTLNPINLLNALVLNLPVVSDIASFCTDASDNLLNRLDDILDKWLDATVHKLMEAF